jgi:hypothetical protein
MIGFSDFLATKGMKKSKQTWSILHGMTFIPTISALGFRNPNFNWNNRVDNRNLLCNNEIFFDNYFVPATNEEHIADLKKGIFMSEKSVAWITQETIKGRNGTDCFNACNIALSGNECIKQGLTTSYNYGFTFLSANIANITTSANLQVISKSTTGFTMKGLTPGAGWIKIEFENPCGANIIIEKVVNVDLPNVPAPSITITQSTSTCNKWWVQMSFGNPNFGTYSWSAFKSGSGTNFSGNSSGSCGFWILNGQNFGWSVSISNACGNLDDGQLNKFNVLSSGCGTGTYSLTPIANGGNRMAKPSATIAETINYSVLPNPTSNHWTIGILSEKVKELNYKLINMQGQILEQNNFNQVAMNDFVVGNANLPKGLYLLKIKTNTGEEALKLLKE